jgi:hypothetical protein
MKMSPIESEKSLIGRDPQKIVRACCYRMDRQRQRRSIEVSGNLDGEKPRWCSSEAHQGDCARNQSY